MEIADLTKFLVIARYENLQKAANELDITPSALSKSLKRLETSLDLLLFDRIGKTLRLNDQGKLLQPRAAQMIALADNTRQQLCGQHQDIHCRVAAPAILQYRWASVISRVVSEQVAQSQSNSTLTFDTAFEQAALNKLKQGEVHLALVTDAMLGQLTPELDYIDLGELQMQVAVGRTHPLVCGAVGDDVGVSVQVSAEELLLHPFALPHVSPFCGEERGLGCDGWQDQLLPRKTGWVVNDYAVLSQLVKSGQAVAYLPDFLLREWGLVRIGLVGNKCWSGERVLLVFWFNKKSLVRQLLERLT